MTATRGRDRGYLRGTQYRDDRNLRARARLHDLFSTNTKGWISWLREHLAEVDGLRVLELGGGPGYLWRAAGPPLTPSELVLSDFSPGMVARAREGLRRLAFPARCLVCDAQTPAFPAACFDVVIANHMLYHVPDRERAFREIRRVLVPGGRFFASTVGLDHMREVFELARAVDPSPGAWMTFEPSISFTLESGGAELERSFSDVEVASYADGLRVTESGPLVDYVASMWSVSELSSSTRAALETRIDEALARDGVVEITKSSGLFRARAPLGARVGSRRATRARLAGRQRRRPPGGRAG